MKKTIDTNSYFVWKNIYGSPADKNNIYAKKMNENPLLGSDWNGRVLIYV